MPRGLRSPRATCRHPLLPALLLPPLALPQLSLGPSPFLPRAWAHLLADIFPPSPLPAITLFWPHQPPHCSSRGLAHSHPYNPLLGTLPPHPYGFTSPPSCQVSLLREAPPLGSPQLPPPAWLMTHLIVALARVRFPSLLSALSPAPSPQLPSQLLLRDLPPPAPASSPQGPGEAARGCGESEDSRDRVPLDSGGCGLQVGGLCGVPGRRTQESGKGPGAAWDGESRPESSTFSGDEEEKGEGLEVKPRLLEPGEKQGD